MTVKQYQPNPLNLFNLRRVEHCPPHFFAVDFDIVTGEKRISDWIWEHLGGRFYLGDIVVNQDQARGLKKRAAFEIHGEGTLFALQLGEINKFSHQ